MCSDCEAYGLKKHGLRWSDYSHILYIYLLAEPVDVADVGLDAVS